MTSWNGKWWWVLTDCHQNSILVQILQKHESVNSLLRPSPGPGKGLVQLRASKLKLHKWDLSLQLENWTANSGAPGQCPVEAGKRLIFLPPIFCLPNSKENKDTWLPCKKVNNTKGKIDWSEHIKTRDEKWYAWAKEGLYEKEGKKQRQNQEDKIKIYYLS